MQLAYISLLLWLCIGEPELDIDDLQLGIDAIDPASRHQVVPTSNYWPLQLRYIDGSRIQFMQAIRRSMDQTCVHAAAKLS